MICLIDRELTIGDVISCERFSSLQRLLRVTAYMQRALSKFRRNTTKSNHSVSPTPQEIAKAEALWITCALKELVRQKDFESLTRQFGLFCDDMGLWRCGGRLHNSEVPFSSKYPILLPRGHHFTTLVVRQAHQRVGHNGVKETLTEVRGRYWIVKGRSCVRAIIYRCVVCKKYEGAPYTGPPAPPLPDFRVKEDPAFTYTGVDFAGPILVRNQSSMGSNKTWICLFTCLVTRAVHLDLVPDLFTKTFIRCQTWIASVVLVRQW